MIFVSATSIINELPTVGKEMLEIPGTSIAGGFPRRIMIDGRFDPRYVSAEGGDIDIFFEDTVARTAAITYMDEHRCRRDGLMFKRLQTRYARMKECPNKPVRIQLILEPIMPIIERLRSFKLANQRIAFSGDRVYVDDAFLAAETKNVVEIVSSDGPWIASHVKKLVARRGLINGLSQRSKPLFWEYVAGHRGNDISEKLFEDIRACLIDPRIISIEELAHHVPMGVCRAGIDVTESALIERFERVLQ